MKPDTENIYQRKINQVIDYINANLHLSLRLDIIAGRVNVSERQLLRIMRGALNESLYAYVARQRVERAVLYMHTEDMSLADLASRVGYDNPQSFSKAFKKQFSVSPKAYMDKLRVRLREETEKWSNASVGKEIIPSGMFGTIRLQKGKYAVYTLKVVMRDYKNYIIINIDFNYTKRHGMAFEEYVSYSEEDDDTQVTKIYIPIK